MMQSTDLKALAIPEIMNRYPQTQAVFEKFGLKAYAVTETAKHENLEASALVHAVDVTALVQALNKAIEG